MATTIKPPNSKRDIKTANKLLTQLRQVDRTEHLLALEKMFLGLKDDIKKATKAWKNQHGWNVNGPYENLQKKFNSIIDTFGGLLHFVLDKEILPMIYKEEWNQKQWWTSHFVEVKARPASTYDIDIALRTLPQYGKPLKDMTVAKHKTSVEIWLEALLPPIHGEVNGKFKALLFVEADRSTFFNWLDRFFQEKINLNVGKLHGRKKAQEGVLGDLMFHVGQIAWQQPLTLVNPSLRAPVIPEDVSNGGVILQEEEIGYDTVTEYKDLVIRVVVLDERTCIRCAPLDGMIFEESQAPTLIHNKCRCYNVPYFPGQMGVLETGNYAPWFEKQDKELQQDILGRRKYLLWEHGVPLKHLRGTWKDLSKFFLDKGLFSVSDIAAIDTYVRTGGSQKAWIKQKLSNVKLLERELRNATNPELKKLLIVEIRDVKADIVLREAIFKERETALDSLLSGIPFTKYPGDIPFDEIAKKAMSVDEYSKGFTDMQKVYLTLKSRALSSSISSRTAAVNASIKDLKDYHSSLPTLEKDILERDWLVFETALRNLIQ